MIGRKYSHQGTLNIIVPGGGGGGEGGGVEGGGWRGGWGGGVVNDWYSLSHGVVDDGNYVQGY